MTHVNDRMAILRFQNGRKYSNNLQNNHNHAQNLNPFAFLNNGGMHGGMRCHDSLMEKMATIDISFQCAGMGLTIIDKILDWCGFGKTKPVKTQQPIVQKNDDTDVKEKKDKNTEDEALSAEQKATLKSGANSAISAAKQNGKINLPEGYTLGDINVADDGSMTVDIKYNDAEGKEQKITITGTDADDVVRQLTSKSQELQKASVQKLLDKQQPPVTPPAGYTIDVSGVDKDGKSNGVYLLKDAKGNVQEFSSIDALINAIKQINSKNPNTKANSTKSTGNNPKKDVDTPDPNKRISDLGLNNYIKVENNEIHFKYKLGATKMVKYSEQMLDQIIKDTKGWLNQ